MTPDMMEFLDKKSYAGPLVEHKINKMYAAGSLGIFIFLFFYFEYVITTLSLTINLYLFFFFGRKILNFNTSVILYFKFEKLNL